MKNITLLNILKGYEEFTLDLNGKIISSNLEAVNITGYEEWEIIGKNIGLFYLKDDFDQDVPNKELNRARQEGKIIFSAWRVKKRNVPFWAQVTIMFMRNVEGINDVYRVVFRDQTYRLISNSRIKRFRNEYLNLFNNTFIGVVKFRLNDFKLLLINDKANSICGNKRDIKKLDEVFKDKKELEIFKDILINRGTTDGFEFQVNHNTEKWARIDCKIFEEDGFAEGIILDITYSKRQVVELQRLNDELDRFVYHASHDLRSPLTTLLGLINLAELDTKIELREYCRMMKDRVNFLDNLLRDMTCIVVNSKTSIRRDKISFIDIFKKAKKYASQMHSGLQISFDHPDVKYEFISDRERIESVFRHLITYASNHCKPVIFNPHLRISIEINPGSAKIKFADNGLGLKDNQLLQIFGMFYKLDSEVKETGLGLYLTKLIIDRMGGQIEVRSSLGQGTEFEIEIPNIYPIESSESCEFQCAGKLYRDFCERCQAYMGGHVNSTCFTESEKLPGNEPELQVVRVPEGDI